MRIGQPKKIVRVGTVAPPIPIKLPVTKPESVPVEPMKVPEKVPLKVGG